jgi:hypothetical protein
MPKPRNSKAGAGSNKKTGTEAKRRGSGAHVGDAATPAKRLHSGPKQAQKRKAGWRRWLAPLHRLGGWMGLPPRRRKRTGPARPAHKNRIAGFGKKRTLAEWKELRRRTAGEVKAHLAEQQPLPAIRKLSRALLEDPQHQAYHNLLAEAVQQRHQRRLKPGRRDPWADLPAKLQRQALELEAFSAYVQELERLIDKAGIPPLKAPQAPGPVLTVMPGATEAESPD